MDSKWILSGRHRGKSLTLDCKHLALGEIRFIVLWMGTYGSRSNVLAMWGTNESGRRSDSLMCQFPLLRRTNWPETWKYLWSIVSLILHYMNIAYLIYPFSCWWTFVLSPTELLASFMYSGYKSLVRYMCCRFFILVYGLPFIFAMMSARAEVLHFDEGLFFNFFLFTVVFWCVPFKFLSQSWKCFLLEIYSFRFCN